MPAPPIRSEIMPRLPGEPGITFVLSHHRRVDVSEWLPAPECTFVLVQALVGVCSLGAEKAGVSAQTGAKMALESFADAARRGMLGIMIDRSMGEHAAPEPAEERDLTTVAVMAGDRLITVTLVCAQRVPNEKSALVIVCSICEALFGLAMQAGHTRPDQYLDGVASKITDDTAEIVTGDAARVAVAGLMGRSPGARGQA